MAISKTINGVPRKRTVVYGLIDPVNNKIFYIGITIRPLKQRLARHIKDRRNKVIHELLKEDKMPTIKQLEVCYGYWAPIRAERRWIAKMKAAGIVLSNQRLMKDNV